MFLNDWDEIAAPEDILHGLGRIHVVESEHAVEDLLEAYQPMHAAGPK